MKQEEDLIVGMPLYQGCTLVDFAGATQVFNASKGFRAIWLSHDPAVTTTEHVSVLPNYPFDHHPPIDILFIPGGGPEGVLQAMQDETYLAFVRKTARTAAWKGSVCTGAFVFAASGVLRDCEATTYWSQIPTLQLLAEKLNLTVTENYYPRYLFDERQHIFTGGGISSSLDLALELVLRIKGVEAAEAAQLYIQYQPAPPTNSGIPSEAPPDIVAPQWEGGKEFAAILKPAIEKILHF
jgi:cyclohexyl-isocyanide hydratase